VADSNREPGPVYMSRTALPTYYPVRTPLASIDVARKVERLQQADAAARSYDKRVKQVTGAYADQTREILVANTLGHLAEDRQDLCRLSVAGVAVGKKGERRTGFYGGGGRVDFRFFEDFSPQQVGREAARQAVATLGAVPAPSGPQTVVLAPGWSGILLHEAVGHGLEADFIRKGTSLFAGKLGEKVASELVTVIDDGTVAGGRGSINVDDEGNPGERKVLIENGVLKGYLYDHLNAKLTGQRSTGSGRRQSFRHAPLPRMTNTYLAPGDQTPEEIIKAVGKGLYCRQFGGGQVDISNGNFVFEISEAYLIEEGEITKPVECATGRWRTCNRLLPRGWGCARLPASGSGLRTGPIFRAPVCSRWRSAPSLWRKARPRTMPTACPAARCSAAPERASTIRPSRTSRRSGSWPPPAPRKRELAPRMRE